MNKMMTIGAAALLVGPIAATGALAGDPAAGEENFRQCAACHGIESPDGEVTQRVMPTGPNLYGVIGRVAGSYEGYTRFSASMVEAGEQGLVWDEENFLAYLENQTGFLRDFLGDNRARGNMNHRLRGSGEDIFAYLAQFSPVEENLEDTAED